MKKIIYIMLLGVLFIPFFTNAKEYCTIVKGSGSNIGDEIQCGTESFYILDNSNKNELKLLTKYNLMTNIVCDLFIFKNTYDSDLSGYSSDAEEELNSLLVSQNDISEVYNTTYKYDENNKIYGAKVCYKKNINADELYKQNENALAYKETNDALDFPFYGLLEMNSLGYEVYEINNDNFEYLNGYKDSRDYEVYGDNFIDLKKK